MRFTLTGSTGFIGRALRERLERQGHECQALSRRERNEAGVFAWDPLGESAPREALLGADAVVHLAGETVAQRWSAEVKRRIRDSRVTGTRNLVAGLRALETRPKVLVCASAVGYYGDRGDEVLTETSAPGTGFLPETCVEWETEARAAEELGMRVVRVRTGVVLGAGGGALAKMLPPFRLGVGGRIGDGRQWMPWIHLRDLVSLLIWAAEEASVASAVNGVAPSPVRNDEFTATLARVLRRPAVFPVPTLALKAMYGEMAGVLLASQRVTPEAAERAGFRFEFRDLEPALEEILGSKRRALGGTEG